MSLALLFHYLMLNVFRMLIHPSSGASDLFDELIHGLYCSGSMCVGVTLWFGWGGVVWFSTNIYDVTYKTQAVFIPVDYLWELCRCIRRYRHLLLSCYVY